MIGVQAFCVKIDRLAVVCVYVCSYVNLVVQCSLVEKAFDLLLQKSVLIHSLLLLFDLPNAIGNNCEEIPAGSCKK